MSDYLVTTSWLADHLEDPNLRVLDVTPMLTSHLENRAEACFDQGHIPHSLFFDVASGNGHLSDPDAALPWTWPSADQFEQTMSDFGIANDSRVVIVARTPREGIDAGTMWCTRAWWTLFHFGVDVAILDGGLERWESEGRPLATGDRENPAPGSFTVDAAWRRGLANQQDVLASLDDANSCLIDSLPSSSYDGTGTSYGPRKGHITGAVNIPYRDLINGETAAFKSREELAEAFADVLAKPEIITYCGAAIAATVDAFALKLLGHKNVSVYDGSLMEWTADEALPMTDPSSE